MAKSKFFQPADSDDKLCVLVVTEIVRWVVIGICIMLTLWRYVYFIGYTSFVPGTNCTNQTAPTDNNASLQLVTTASGESNITSQCLKEFWLISFAIFIVASLVVYVPIKIFLAKSVLRDARYLYGWRPSILIYLILCTLPCMVLLLLGISSEKGLQKSNIDSDTMTVIQAIVMGLTVTEWMAKFREETLTFDLVTAMSVDFFFAYDVFDFFDMFLVTEKLYNTPWMYVNFVLAYVAMFKYLPQQPTNECCGIYYKRSAICILVTLFCNDLPFVVIRIAVMATYGTETSDIIHPLKNIALIFFGLAQLYILHRNRTSLSHNEKPEYSERRCQRNSKIDYIEPTTQSADIGDGVLNNSFDLQQLGGVQTSANGDIRRNRKTTIKT